ncbi:hypothetical protein [Sulfurimonas sp.]|uniref:hypothetical protein n=1 Tax=Sulfurimonas sp. TaxID=2022749 RepID=UPI00356B433E
MIENKEKYVLIFTKSNWDEAPRIRHQVTNLLTKVGKKVIFFQKAYNIPKANRFEKINENLYTVNYYEPFHHQLKFINILNTFNNYITKKNIQKVLGDINIDYIVNFNYDYDFLRDIFKSEKIVTVINDDFVAQAKPFRKKYAEKLLVDTCAKSDKVLAMSTSIYKDLETYNKNIHLFLPWAENKYSKPKEIEKRDIVLFYGYINDRLDWEFIEGILKKNIKVRFVGPIVKSSIQNVEKLKNYNNFEYTGTSDINSLYCDDVVLSFIPYVKDQKDVQAITINNKSFNLLSKGIPLVYPNLPNLMKCDSYAISKYLDVESFINDYEYIKSNFFEIQKDIKVLLEENYIESRYSLILDV